MKILQKKTLTHYTKGGQKSTILFSWIITINDSFREFFLINPAQWSFLMLKFLFICNLESVSVNFTSC